MAGATAERGQRPLAAVSWSGGKDSCAALARARSSFDVVAMVTMFDEEATRSRSHGVRAVGPWM
jgi:diphthamide synthase (EF-2-diphthine--ammonia ligase)